MIHMSYGQALVEESIWQSLEDDIIPSLNSGKSNWLELQSKLLPKKYKESNVCVAGGMQVVVSCICCLRQLSTAMSKICFPLWCQQQDISI